MVKRRSCGGKGDEIFTFRLSTPGMNEEIKQALQIVQQQERKLRRQRQAEGIAAAKARGVPFGRPRIETPANFAVIVSEWEHKRISLDTASKLCGMSSSTFFRRVREHRRKLEK